MESQVAHVKNPAYAEIKLLGSEPMKVYVRIFVVWVWRRLFFPVLSFLADGLVFVFAAVMSLLEYIIVFALIGSMFFLFVFMVYFC